MTFEDEVFEIRQNMILTAEGLQAVGMTVAFGDADREALGHAVTALGQYALHLCNEFERAEIRARKEVAQ